MRIKNNLLHACFFTITNSFIFSVFYITIDSANAKYKNNNCTEKTKKLQCWSLISPNGAYFCRNGSLCSYKTGTARWDVFLAGYISRRVRFTDCFTSETTTCFFWSWRVWSYQLFSRESKSKHASLLPSINYLPCHDNFSFSHVYSYRKEASFHLYVGVVLNVEMVIM